MMSARIILFLLLGLVGLAGCGGDDDGGYKSASSYKPSKSKPKNLRPKRRRRGKPKKKGANINLFASEKLSIPPFNEAAQSVPPELFSENGKDQRDPFRNFSEAENIPGKATTENTDPGAENSIILFENFALNELKLTGIVWSAGRERALFASPNGQPTTVLKEDRISKSRALVKEITHDKVIVEIPARPGEVGKVMTYSLVRASGPYQIQYDKLRADQRGIRIRLNRWRSRRRRSHE